MAEPNIPKMKPDEKLLKRVGADNAAVLAKTNLNEEPPTYADQKAVSSDPKVNELNNG